MNFFKILGVNWEDDYWKGYFLHLLTDQIFYHEWFEEETNQIRIDHAKFYPDYDCLNTILIPKYQIEVQDSFERYLNQSLKEPHYLKLEKIIHFIESFAQINLTNEMKKRKREMEEC